MSYILGALKKAEKERRRDRGLDLNDWDQDSWNQAGQSGSQNSLLLWMVSATLLVVLVIFAWLAYRIIGASPQTTSTQAPVIESASPVVEVISKEIDQESKESIRVEPTEIVPVIIEVNEAALEPGNADYGAQADEAVLPEFSGHIYFPGNSSLSRVFSGADSYREGDLISAYRVKEILEREVILENQGREFTVKLDK